MHITEKERHKRFLRGNTNREKITGRRIHYNPLVIGFTEIA